MNPTKILLVDDEPRGRQLLRDLLTPEGYQLVEAVDGEDAIATAVLEIPDVILLDVMMPKLDGFEVCKRLRGHQKLQHVPIIMLTALDDRRSRLRGLEMGADDFISKPIDALELRVRLRNLSKLNRFRALSEERERFFSAMTHSPDGIVIADPHGRILFANTAFTRSLDPATWSEADEHGFFDAFPAESAEALRECAFRAAADGPARPAIETPLAHPAVPDTHVAVTAGRLLWDGQVAVQFNLRDITEKKRLETQLLRTQRLELLGQLSSGIVHDVNNIFAAILGNAQLLDGADPEKVPTLTAAILRAATRGTTVLRQLLSFARGSDGEFQEVLPGGALAEVASVIRETFGRELRIEFHAADDLPVITADPNQLHQIIMNLAVNARDAMPANGCITFSAVRRIVSAQDAAALGGEARAGDFVTLSVRDTGTGIPPEVRDRLFDPFFTTKEPGKGTGLGLATVLRLVRRHQGFVTLETAVGKGTCFHCYLPLAQDPNLPTAA